MSRYANTIRVKVPLIFSDHFVSDRGSEGIEIVRQGRRNAKLAVDKDGFAALHDYAGEIERLDSLGALEERFEYIEDLETRFEAVSRLGRSARAARLRLNDAAQRHVSGRGRLPWEDPA